MIDLIDDLVDFADVIEPGPSWFECPILRQDEMLATIKRKGSLDGRSVNLFSALERPAARGCGRDSGTRPGW